MERREAVKATLTATESKPAKIRYAGKEKEFQAKAGRKLYFRAGALTVI